MAKPLYDLLRKDRAFEFGKEELDCFTLFMDKLVATSVLALYDHRDEVELHCDASSSGFGAVLFPRKEDRKMHPIFYFSKRSTATEAKYHSFELETLAIIYALRRFFIYSQGKPFRIVTDRMSRIARWSL